MCLNLNGYDHTDFSEADFIIILWLEPALAHDALRHQEKRSIRISIEITLLTFISSSMYTNAILTVLFSNISYMLQYIDAQ